MAFLNKGLTIKITDERPDRLDEDGEQLTDTFHYAEGITDYVRYLTRAKDPIHSTIIDVESEWADEGLSIEIAMQWTTSYAESVHTFANTINTHEVARMRKGSVRR